jgi:hypothetical protein
MNDTRTESAYDRKTSPIRTTQRDRDRLQACLDPHPGEAMRRQQRWYAFKVADGWTEESGDEIAPFDATVLAFVRQEVRAESGTVSPAPVGCSGMACEAMGHSPDCPSRAPEAAPPEITTPANHCPECESYIDPPGSGCWRCEEAASPEVTTENLDRVPVWIKTGLPIPMDGCLLLECSLIRQSEAQESARRDIRANLDRQAEAHARELLAANKRAEALIDEADQTARLYARERAADKARIAELQTTVDGRGRIIAEQESECSRRAARNATLASERDEVVAKLTDLEAEADTLRTVHDREVRDALESQRRIADLETQLTASRRLQVEDVQLAGCAMRERDEAQARFVNLRDNSHESKEIRKLAKALSDEIESVSEAVKRAEMAENISEGRRKEAEANAQAARDLARAKDLSFFTRDHHKGCACVQCEELHGLVSLD